jgi:hypothetical protein
VEIVKERRENCLSLSADLSNLFRYLQKISSFLFFNNRMIFAILSFTQMRCHKHTLIGSDFPFDAPKIEHHLLGEIMALSACLEKRVPEAVNWNQKEKRAI